MYRCQMSLLLAAEANQYLILADLCNATLVIIIVCDTYVL